MHQQTLAIREQIIQAVRAGVVGLNNHIQAQFKISRQAVNQHLNNLESAGFLISSGNTKNKIYQLGAIRRQSKVIMLNEEVDEFEVYSQDFEWVVENAAKNIREIVDWGFTEILNNAVEHANATQVFISLEIDNNCVTLIIEDDGEGIFKRVKRLKKLQNEQQAVFELSKGKLTTDSQNHTGLGIFFSSKAFDLFSANSFGVCTDFYNSENDGFNFAGSSASTCIAMTIALSSTTKLKTVFDKFAKAPEFEFDTTIVPLCLVNKKQKLVSRSQAKKVTDHLEKFKFVTFDFKGIETIGQGFADELFRVYPNKNPQISFDYINAEIEVEKMIKRVKR